jgi:membrane associated rhomboid family serine protease
MMPIGDENREGRTTPYVNYVLILINIAVFIYELSIGHARLERFFLQWGAVPREVIGNGEWTTILTSMFLHDGVFHIFGNMLFLNIFGDNIEDALGHWRYAVFYFATGIGAQLLHVMLNSSSSVVTIGASGAISGVLGAYLVLFRTNNVRVWWGFFTSWVPAWAMIGLWAAEQFLATWTTVMHRISDGPGVAYAAHVGGFVSGVALALVMRKGRRDVIEDRGGYAQGFWQS